MKISIRKKIFTVFTAFSFLLAFTTGCENTSNAVKGGATGAGAGGAIGGVIGNKAGNTAVGVLVGAAVGGTAGALIGKYMDKQAEEIEENVDGVEVERVGEGILLSFDSGLMFDFDSYNLRPGTKEDLQDLENIMEDYDDTEVQVIGHTDSRGSESYNQKLSEERAESVEDYLQSLGIDSGRISSVGYGESDPIATNETEAGRQQNRRVEVIIYADEDLKEQAREGELSSL